MQVKRHIDLVTHLNITTGSNGYFPRLMLLIRIKYFPIPIGQVFMWTISYLDVSRSFRFGTCIYTFPTLLVYS